MCPKADDTANNMALSRRDILPITGTTVLFGGLAGCLGFFEGGGVGIQIENLDDQQHTLKVAFREETDTMFSEQYTISSGEETEVSDVVEPREYTVIVTSSSSEETTLNFTMQGCNYNSVYVSIDESGRVNVRILNAC